MPEKDFEKFSKEFLKLIREANLSQECEGTLKIKDGIVTDINITGIAIVPNADERKWS